MTRTILATGGTGQVGHALGQLAWPADVELHLPPRAELDLGSTDSIAAVFEARRYDAILSCGAYTAVDKAEDDVVTAFQVNAVGPAALAAAATAAGIPIVHVSTDYVFDGSGAGARDEDAAVRPLGVYGASKLAGELAVLSGTPRATVMRTAWVISAFGANFLKTMLRVGATNPVLRVVADQHGSPTAAGDIALALQTIVLRQLDDADAPRGTYHFVNAGEASWFDLASTIFASAQARGGPSPQVDPITTAEFPTRATRPANSRLATTRIERDYGIVPRPWQTAVDDILDELLVKGSAR